MLSNVLSQTCWSTGAVALASPTQQCPSPTPTPCAVALAPALVPSCSYARACFKMCVLVFSSVCMVCVVCFGEWEGGSSGGARVVALEWWRSSGGAQVVASVRLGLAVA